MGKKKFIDKKSAQTFHVVHRSQRDIAIKDESTTPYVLKPVVKTVEEAKEAEEHLKKLNLGDLIGNEVNIEDFDFEDHDGEEFEDIPKVKEKINDEDKFADADTESISTELNTNNKLNVKSNIPVVLPNYRVNDYEFGEYGFIDDGYDYSKHFKMRGNGLFIPTTTIKKDEKKKTNLVDSILKGKEKVNTETTPVEIDIQNFEDAEEIDEEILAALDIEDNNEFNELQDNFVVLANEHKENNEDDLPELEEGDDDDDDIILTSEKLTTPTPVKKLNSDQQEILNAKFERIAAAFGDDDIGELEEDDPSVKGGQNIDQFADVLDEFLDTQNKTVIDIHTAINTKTPKTTEDIYEIKERILQYADISDSEESNEETEIIEIEHIEDKWDCESILSTYSTTENHPGIISEKSKSKKKPQVPIEQVAKIELSKKNRCTIRCTTW